MKQILKHYVQEEREEERQTKAGAAASAEEHCQKNGEPANDLGLKMLVYFIKLKAKKRCEWNSQIYQA